MKPNLTVVLAVIAVLTAAYGLTRIEEPSEPGSALSTLPKEGTEVGSPTKLGPSAASTQLSRGSVSVDDAHHATAAVEIADSLVESDAWSEEPPLDIGEFLDAAEDELWSPTVTEDDPVEIGPELDVDDPWAWELFEEPHDPIEVGTFLNAGEPRDY